MLHTLVPILSLLHTFLITYLVPHTFVPQLWPCSHFCAYTFVPSHFSPSTFGALHCWSQQQPCLTLLSIYCRWLTLFYLYLWRLTLLVLCSSLASPFCPYTIIVSHFSSYTSADSPFWPSAVAFEDDHFAAPIMLRTEKRPFLCIEKSRGQTRSRARLTPPVLLSNKNKTLCWLRYVSQGRRVLCCSWFQRGLWDWVEESELRADWHKSLTLHHHRLPEQYPCRWRGRRTSARIMKHLVQPATHSFPTHILVWQKVRPMTHNESLKQRVLS